ncbi:MAG: nucleotide sugar dehydrogenase [Dehalococcoidia bacterium]
MRVAVVGLGKIGLPLAAQYASKGATVIGCDVNAAVVEAVNAGISTVGGEPGLDDAVRAAHESGRLSATLDTTAAVAESDVIVVIVRVGIDEDRRTDFSNLDAAAAAIGRGLKPGSLVILECTVPVGSTRQRFGEALQAASGLEAGAFRLAYSPERVSSGTMFRDLKAYPKLVGGIDEASGEAAAAFYREMLDAEVVVLPNAETAEFTKLAESVYRDVNIALANELAKAADAAGVDYRAMAAAANSQPYSHLHQPGLGVGGHCIPVYPYLLMEIGDQPLIKLSREINDSMAAYASDRLEAALQETGSGLSGANVLILGLAYRGGVKEATLSSTLLLARELTLRGARVSVHDPLFDDAEIRAHGLEPSRLPPSGAIDAVVLQAAHPEYRDLEIGQLGGARVFLDGRGSNDRARFEAAGVRYIAIGA